jgi:hypothetical protein
MYDNCFGGNGRNGCNILTVHKCLQDKCSFYKFLYLHIQLEPYNVHKCLQDKCSFYKSTQELEEDRKKAYLLLAALSPDMQRYISDKYYNGRMPWANSKCVVQYSR